MSHEIATTLSLLFSPDQVVEMRTISDDGIGSGYYQDPVKLAHDAEVADTGNLQGIYVTLNEINPVLLSRRANRIKMRLSKKDATTADNDITRRRWFPIDIDPVRPSGVSSSLDEHHAAIEKAGEIGIYLAERGFPVPLVADSGNGAHLLYRIDLPNDDDSRDIIKQCLVVLASIFDDKESTIDISNHNAARIWKLYGTTGRKGDNTTDRPHRRSRVIEPGAQIVVSRDMLKNLVNSIIPDVPLQIPEQKSYAPGSPIDLREWLTRYGIAFSDEKPHQGGTIYPLDECPFSMAHKDGAYAIQFGNGAIFAGCHHNSCGGGQQRWRELREKYEPQKKKEGPGPGPRPVPTTNILPGDLPGKDLALTILQAGDPIKGMLACFARDHEGDQVLAECLILSLASRSVVNTNGLHVSVTGVSGKGKSHAFNTMLKQVPPKHRLKGRLSNKALFYLDDPLPGTIILLDDSTLSDEMGEILKGVTTSFLEPFIYRTVSKDRKGQVCMIPERCVWWIAKVEGMGDDQVFNRMLTVWIDDSIDQDSRVVTRILGKDVDLPTFHRTEREDIEVCRAMWDILGDIRIFVSVPFGPRIKFESVSNRRNPEMLMDLIKAYAVLRFMQRVRIESGGVTCITANEADFQSASNLYSLLNGTSGGQTTKLTRQEASILGVISKKGWYEFTLSMLQKETGLANGTLHRNFHGSSSRGCMYSGLLEKCPAIAYTDRTVVCEEDGISMRRRSHAFTFDKMIYESWSKGGIVWLTSEPIGIKSEPKMESYMTDSKPAENLDFPEFPGITAENSAGLVDGCGVTESNSKHTHTHLVSTNSMICGELDLTSKSKLMPDSLCDPGLSAGFNTISNDLALPGNREVLHEASICGVLRETPGNGDFSAGSGNSPNFKIKPAKNFNPREYKRMENYNDRSCSMCGRKRDTWYIEVITPRRKKNPSVDPWYLCQKCYQKGVKRYQDTCTILPGAFAPDRLEEVTVNIGRCSICGLEKATWKDTSNGLRVCDSCYHRENGKVAEAAP